MGYIPEPDNHPAYILNSPWLLETYGYKCVEGRAAGFSPDDVSISIAKCHIKLPTRSSSSEIRKE
jgi:hypothetical protein